MAKCNDSVGIRPLQLFDAVANVTHTLFLNKEDYERALTDKDNYLYEKFLSSYK